MVFGMRGKELIQVGGDVIVRDATKDQVSIYERAGSDQDATAALLQQVQDDGTIVRQSAQCNP